MINNTSPRISRNAQFVFRNHQSLMRRVLLREAMDFITLDGLYLEFGVYYGFTINHMAQCLPNKTIYGFDSWEGIPEEWWVKDDYHPKGCYSTEGKLPRVESNVKLVSGRFEDTLPLFAQEHPNKPTAFVHIDSDVYSSCKTIFKYMGHTFQPGTVIAFDEWTQDVGEMQAFNEWLDETGLYATMIRQSHQQAYFVITADQNPIPPVKITWEVTPPANIP